MGSTPSETVFNNCAVLVQNRGLKSSKNTTETFWRDIENIQVNGNILWYVSQACPLRRIRHKGDQFYLNSGMQGAWASGGWISNIATDSTIKGYQQQQFCLKNIDGNMNADGRIQTVGMNYTIINSNVPNQNSCGNGGAGAVSVIRDLDSWSKPWLVQNGIMIPSMSNSNGDDLKVPAQYMIDESRIFVVTPGVSYETIQGNINDVDIDAVIFTSGEYSFTSTFVINRDNFVVFGLGYPIINASTNTNPIFTITADNCWISSLILDAGTGDPVALLLVGLEEQNYEVQGTKMHDIYTRLFPGGSCKTMITINQNNVYAENLWLWVADHGPRPDGSNGAYDTADEWNSMKCPNGLTVIGDDVTICGLAVEHQSAVMTDWIGDGGRCYFYQSEYPYNGNFTPGPSYRVDPDVSTHDFSSGGAYFVYWDPKTPVPPTPPDIPYVGEFPDEPGIDIGFLLGANWQGYDTIKKVIKLGSDVHRTVQPNGSRYYCTY